MSLTSNEMIFLRAALWHGKGLTDTGSFSPWAKLVLKKAEEMELLLREDKPYANPSYHLTPAGTDFLGVA